MSKQPLLMMQTVECVIRIRFPSAKYPNGLLMQHVGCAGWEPETWEYLLKPGQFIHSNDHEVVGLAIRQAAYIAEGACLGFTCVSVSGRPDETAVVCSEQIESSGVQSIEDEAAADLASVPRVLASAIERLQDRPFPKVIRLGFTREAGSDESDRAIAQELGRICRSAMGQGWSVFFSEEIPVERTDSPMSFFYDLPVTHFMNNPHGILYPKD